MSLFNELSIKQTSDKSINKMFHDNKDVTNLVSRRFDKQMDKIDLKIIAELFNNYFSPIVEEYVTDSEFKQYKT